MDDGGGFRAKGRRAGAAVVRVADLIGTAVFAAEGALAALAAGLDPVGVIALAFATALGGGVVRDLMIGAVPPAAIQGWTYCATVLAAAATAWAAAPLLSGLSWTLTLLDAAGLGLFAVAGTSKAVSHGIHPVPAVFLGATGAAGGGVIRDVLLNQVPHVLSTDVYASAALLACVIVAAAGSLRLPPAPAGAVAVAACFALRVAAVSRGWHLPGGR